MWGPPPHTPTWCSPHCRQQQVGGQGTAPASQCCTWGLCTTGTCSSHIHTRQALNWTSWESSMGAGLHLLPLCETAQQRMGKAAISRAGLPSCASMGAAGVCCRADMPSRLCFSPPPPPPCHAVLAGAMPHQVPAPAPGMRTLSTLPCCCSWQWCLCTMGMGGFPTSPTSSYIHTLPSPPPWVQALCCSPCFHPAAAPSFLPMSQHPPLLCHFPTCFPE